MPTIPALKQVSLENWATSPRHSLIEIGQLPGGADSIFRSLVSSKCAHPQ